MPIDQPPCRRRHISPKPEDLTPEQLPVYRAIVEGPRKGQAALVPVVDDDGRLLGPFGVMLIAPDLGDSVQSVGAALRFHGRLDPLVRELIILSVAVHRRCGFEWFAHESMARTAGLTDEQLAALHDGTEPPGLAGPHATTWKVLRSILLEYKMDDVLFAEAIAAIGEEGLAETVWLCGYYSMLATAISTFDPELPEAVDGIFEDR